MNPRPAIKADGWRGHLLVRSLGLAVIAVCAGTAHVAAGVSAPESETEVSSYGLGGGRFLIIAPAGDEGLGLARLADEAWKAWRDPLALPDHFGTPITVRLVSGAWPFPEPDWKVVGEPGGVVTLWIRGGGPSDLARTRRWLTALAEGALHRQAVWLGVAPTRVTVPRWLAAAAAEAALIRENPALLDAWQHDALRSPPLPTLRFTLIGEGTQATAPQQAAMAGDTQRLSAYGVWRWLQEVSGRSSAWRDFVSDLLGGSAPGLALVRAYGSRLGQTDAAELEMAWQVGAAGAARARTLPLLAASESRARLVELERLVAREATTGTERVLRIGEIWAVRNDSWVMAERDVRLRWLNSNHRRVHPFYRNAAGSLGRILTAQRYGDETDWRLAVEDWREDMAAGLALEQASSALLDAATR